MATQGRISRYERTIRRMVNEGRGTGHGMNYKPWLTPQDFSSKGRTHEIHNSLTAQGRKHVFFSDLEVAVFQHFDFSENVIDVREQFPLADRDMTMLIASEMNLKHPTYSDGTPIVMSTDFLIDYEVEGKIKQAVRTVKYAKDLNNRRTIEKFAIEREYFLRKYGINDWLIVTEREIDPIEQKNLCSIYPCINLGSNSFFYGFLESELDEMKEWLLQVLEESDQSCCGILESFEDEFLLEPGAGRTMFKHLLANHRIKADLSIPLDSIIERFKH